MNEILKESVRVYFSKWIKEMKPHLYKAIKDRDYIDIINRLDIFIANDFKARVMKEAWDNAAGLGTKKLSSDFNQVFKGYEDEDWTWLVSIKELQKIMEGNKESEGE